MWSLNVNTSWFAQQAFLHELRQTEDDIVLLQEPHINHLGLTIATSGWIPIYPMHHQKMPKKTRSLILVNKRLATGSWTSLPIPSSDATAVQITLKDYDLIVINIYNDCKNNATIQLVDGHLRQRTDRRRTNYVWAGDFNRHHPLWDEQRNTHLFTKANLELTQPLLNLIGDYGLKMALPAGIPTLQALSTGNYTRVDNIFVSESLTSLITKCTTDASHRPPKTDHIPIELVVQTTVDYAPEAPKRSFKKVDWAKFRETLQSRLNSLPPPAELSNIADMYRALDALEGAVAETIEDHVPMTNPTPFSKRWFNDECRALRKENRRLARQTYRWRHIPDHPVHDEFRDARNKYAATMKKSSVKHWEEWLETTTGDDVWDKCSYISQAPNDGARTRIPELHTRENGVPKVAKTNAEKAKILRDQFFLPKPNVSYVPARPSYPKAMWKFRPITDEQVYDAFKSMKKGKATLPGSIPNDALNLCADLLTPFIAPIYRATFSLNEYPTRFSRSNTIVLRKPGKGDYTEPGAWRPITLSDGLGRGLNTVVCKELLAQTELLNLIPPNHFGGRPGRSTMDSIHLLVSTIKDAWRRGDIVSVLFLDVKGAFPSVDIPMFLHELRNRGIPKEYSQWFKRRFSQRTTYLTFDDYTSEPFAIENGLDQGDPASQLAYILYNASLLETLKGDKQNSLGFVDDVAITAQAKSFEEAHKMIEKAVGGENGTERWAKSHNCIFGLPKWQCVDFTRRRRKAKRRPGQKETTELDVGKPLNVEGRQIPISKVAKFLGIQVDAALRWKEQAMEAVRKGDDWVVKLRRVAKVTKGIPRDALRRAYLGIAVPRMLYGADIFLNPEREQTKKRADGRSSSAIIRKLEAIQRKAAILITGAMKTTAGDTLDIHAGLLPMELMVEKQMQRAAVRYATLPATHPLHATTTRAARRFIKRHRAPMHWLMHNYNINPKNMEKISAIRYDTTWKSKIKINIPRDAVEGIEMDEEDTGLRVYTDGSGYEGGVGGAAVAFDGEERVEVRKIYLGPEDEHEVYEGEGCGLVIAIRLLAKLGRRIGKATICTDSRAAIMATQLRKPGPAHYIFDAFHEEVELMLDEHPDADITIRWVPAHVGIPGNEAADEEAKKATKGPEETTPKKKLPLALRRPLPCSATAMKRVFQRSLQERQDKAWSISKRRAQLRDVDDRPAHTITKEYATATKTLPRKAASILTQLRTGHIPLNHHLARIQSIDLSTCPSCGYHRETVEHYLLRCPKHHKIRRQLRVRIKSTQNLELRDILNEPKNVRHLMWYIAETERFQSAYGNIPTLPKPI